MKLKHATQLAIIGLILRIIIHSIYILVDLEIIYQYNEMGMPYGYFKYLGILSVISYIFILTFFVALRKNQ